MTPVALEPATRAPEGEALRRLRTLVSPLTGLVSSVDEILTAPSDARLVLINSRVADLNQLFGRSPSLEAGGYSPTRDGALAAALGEVAERYSAAHLPLGRAPFATADELGAAAVPPERFALFHESQYASPGFPFRRFTSSTRIRWVEGFALPDGEPAWLPVQLVYLPFSLCHATGEEPICYSTSNGAACGTSLEDAILRGLLEVLERDAFQLVWLNRLTLPRVDWREDPDMLAFDRRYFRPSGLTYDAVDLSIFHRVPTVLAVVRGRSRNEAPFGVGASAGATVMEAWRRAFAEAFAVRLWAQFMLVNGQARQYAPDYSDIRTFDDHTLFYADWQHMRYVEFLDSSKERRDPRAVPPLAGSDLRTQIEEVCRRLAAGGARAYAVDITAPDIRAAGLCVVKVVVPELTQLDVAHAYRFLGGDRLFRLPFELGLCPLPLALEDVNPYPHPFP
jgi:ribosomal protein S12 methylthiotransferase accessory factor